MRAPVSVWGKDHWDTLLYVESVCVDSFTTENFGQVEPDRMRSGPENRTLASATAVANGAVSGRYPTRLLGTQVLEGHDDWDCLADMEEAGMVEIISLAVGQVRMTDRGHACSAAVRVARAKGDHQAAAGHKAWDEWQEGIDVPTTNA